MRPGADGMGRYPQEVGLMARSPTTWLRIGGLTLLAAAIAALAGAVTVLACTNVMGPLSISPLSGPSGSTITTSASGLKAHAMYQLHFAKGTNGNCMSFRGVLTLATIATDGSGGWSNVAATIPTGATMGVHSTCGMESKPVKGGTGTTHETFTVT